MANNAIFSYGAFRYIAKMLRLKEIRKSRGYKQAEVAAMLGLDLTNYNRLENGKTEMTVSRMEQLASLLNCEPVDLIADRGNIRTVQVRQHVEAGSWSESPLWPEDDWYNVAVPNDPEYSKLALYGAETRGPSMNRRYPEKSAIIYTDIIETGETPQVGKRYIVETDRRDGLREATVKTLWRDDNGELWLLPDSDDPRHRQPIPLAGEDGETVRIVGRVVYAVQRD